MDRTKTFDVKEALAISGLSVVCGIDKKKMSLSFRKGKPDVAISIARKFAKCNFFCQKTAVTAFKKITFNPKHCKKLMAKLLA